FGGSWNSGDPSAWSASSFISSNERCTSRAIQELRMLRMRFFWPDRGRAQALGRDPAINVEPFLSADFLKFFLPLAAGVVGWLANERAKRQTEEYTRKEQRYRVLLLSLQ